MNEEKNVDLLIAVKGACFLSFFINILLITVFSGMSSADSPIAFFTIFIPSLLYSCISYIAIPLVIFFITKGKPKEKFLFSDILDMAVIMIIYFISYISFIIYFNTVERDPISDGLMIISSPWIINIIIMVIYSLYLLFRKILRSKSKR